jgi:glycosyltransferase involved in cell wall biosynthesis
MVSRLLVIVPDRLSDLARKGEITARYYNPGDVFDEVHVLMINDDRPDVVSLAPLAGRARLVLHTLPPPSFAATLGWRPSLVSPWASKAVALADAIQPRVVRCYAPWLNGIAGVAIRRRLGVPLVVSVHINPDVDVRPRLSWRDPKAKVFWMASRAVERYVLPRADLVLPVYASARRYAEQLGARRIEVVYNAVTPDRLASKTSYTLSSPPRIISVGRQFDAKFPEHVIRAAASIGATVTLVGNGPRHGDLRRIAAECGAQATFLDAVRNDDLCASLPSYDVFATHSEYWEISKSVLEALLVGLPVVLNRRTGEPVPELTPDLCQLVDNSTAGYAAALRALFDDESRRRTMGERARIESLRRFDPRRMEERVAAIYRDLLATAPR